MEEDAV